ncbi:MAG: DUF4388 domain-containing protein [Candidatus Zixiibacteriota bacterium]
MDTEHSQKRIDEILLQQGKVSEAEIAAALNRQKAVGGKLCSHLLESGTAAEEDLVRALSEHFGRPGVKLSTIDIAPEIFGLIPAKVALSRLVLPFDYQAGENLVKIACLDPDNDELIAELKYLLGDKAIELHVAVELALTRAINRYYGQSRLMISFPHKPGLPETGESPDAITFAAGHAPVPRPVDKKLILTVTNQTGTSQLLKVVLEKEGFQVTNTNVMEQAEHLLRQSFFGAVFIQTEIPGYSPDLVSCLRLASPSTLVTPFRTIADLLIKDPQPNQVSGKLQQKLELFASLLTINERVPKNQSMRVAYFVDKICRRLGLNDHQRVLVLSAAHLHERAKFYYMTVMPRDFRRLTDLVIKLLQSVYYEPGVIEILRSMYHPVSAEKKDDLSLELLGGNILTMVDIFSEQLQPAQHLTLDRIEDFRKTAASKVNRQLLPEVFETFMAVLKEESLRTPVASHSGQIMIYAEKAEQVLALSDRLKSEGFRTIITPSWTSFARLYRRCRPDLIVLYIDGPPRTIFALVKELKNLEIDFKRTPTLLMAPQVHSGELTPLLEWGVEDILDCECDPDRVALNISKVWTRIEMYANSADNGDTALESRGRLKDMNLIELLQVLGTGGRTTRIQVAPSEHAADKLDIYLNRGQIVYARYNDLQGAEAIYVGITWDSGVWTLEPITEEHIRGHNNQLSNEAILLEGCRLLDEMNICY